MEPSILNSTKKILGLAENYTAFDLDVITHINATFSVLDQLGVGPFDGFMIEDATAVWDSLELPMNQLNLVRTYMFLNVRLLFDPPATSFHLSAAKAQLDEYVWRLSAMRESLIPVPVDPRRSNDEYC